MKHYKCFTRDYADQIVKELNEHQDWHPVSIVYDERNWDFKLFYYIEDDNGNLVDPHRFYVCPTCGAIVDISDEKNRRYIYE